MARPDDIAGDVVLAEAAAWLVRLQAGERRPAVDSAFEDWMANPEHARAFERASHTWDIIPRAARLRPKRPQPTRSWRARGPFWPVFAGSLFAVVALAIGALVLFWAQTAVYTTRPGQLQTVTLRDGTRVTLNTDSEMKVGYSLWERRVRLVRGEAIFQVARHPHRPFVVAAGDDQVHDVGTVFTVRETGEKLAVFLVSGSVEITRSPPSEKGHVKVATLSPGERLRILGNGSATLDHPNAAAQLAWLHGEVIFADRPLAEAAAEINRYGGPPVELADPSLGALRVSGVFQTRNAAEFTAVVAELDHLRVERRHGSLVLVR